MDGLRSNDVFMERGDRARPVRRSRVHRTVEEKRRVVELSLQPGMSVARAAQSAGVNANQVFKWRQDYHHGLLLDPEETATSLIPVVVPQSTCDPGIERSMPTISAPAPPSGAIHIDFPGRALIRVEHGADGALLRTILESLRR